MAAKAQTNTRQQGLQQAAAILFTLMAVVPLLVFAFTLWHVGAIQHTFAQASLALTLVLALLGYWMFRSMLGQMSEIVKGMSRVVQTVARPGRTAGIAAAVPVPPLPVARDVAGLGSIWELSEMARTMDQLWQREARAHVGRRVQITVANDAQEVAGRLVEATEDGVLLEQAGGNTVAITYRRVQGIEALID